MPAEAFREVLWSARESRLNVGRPRAAGILARQTGRLRARHLSYEHPPEPFYLRGLVAHRQTPSPLRRCAWEPALAASARAHTAAVHQTPRALQGARAALRARFRLLTKILQRSVRSPGGIHRREAKLPAARPRSQLRARGRRSTSTSRLRGTHAVAAPPPEPLRGRIFARHASRRKSDPGREVRVHISYSLRVLTKTLAAHTRGPNGTRPRE